MHPKVGLVLGGGGSRGIAHIGVLQVLVREGIPADCAPGGHIRLDLIVGTSMGGIVGVLFALGITPDEMADRMGGIQGVSLLNVRQLSARARQRVLGDFLAEELEGKTFADLKIPVALMTVDMVHGTEVALTEGPLLPAVLATCAVPPIFPPVEFSGMQLADGGVIDSLATHVAFERGVDKVIAVDIHPPLEENNPWVDPISDVMGFRLPFGLLEAKDWTTTPSIIASTWRAVRIMAWYIHEERLRAHPPDVLLRPRVESYGMLDFKDLSSPLRAGVAEAERQLAEIRTAIGCGWR